jgi:hypothetical protein
MRKPGVKSQMYVCDAVTDLMIDSTTKSTDVRVGRNVANECVDEEELRYSRFAREIK